MKNIPDKAIYLWAVFFQKVNHIFDAYLESYEDFKYILVTTRNTFGEMLLNINIWKFLFFFKRFGVMKIRKEHYTFYPFFF